MLPQNLAQGSFQNADFASTSQSADPTIQNSTVISTQSASIHATSDTVPETSSALVARRHSMALDSPSEAASNYHIRNELQRRSIRRSSCMLTNLITNPPEYNTI